MFKRAVCLYLIVAGGMIVTSIITTRRALRTTGEPHYLLTQTVVLVDREVPAENATDAAVDQLFEEAGEATETTVEQPLFVLGFLDATAPTVLAGGIGLAIWWAVRRRRALASPPRSGYDDGLAAARKTVPPSGRIEE